MTKKPTPAGRRRHRFPTADYYDCLDSERLEHESPEEAVRDWLECWMSRDCDTRAVIAEHAPVTVRAFRRGTSDSCVRVGNAIVLDAGAIEAMMRDYEPELFLDTLARTRTNR